MNQAVPLSRALAGAVLSASALEHALERAAEIYAIAIDAPAIEVRLEAFGTICTARYGDVCDLRHSLHAEYAQVTLSIAYPAGVQADEALADVLALALQARLSAESAEIDALTGVHSRRSLERRLSESYAGALAILDIDYFKAYNDRRGHPAGDAVLRRVAHAASATLQRPEDFFARYGGEEFVALISGADLNEAIMAAERMREAVLALGIPHSGGKGGRVTISIGVATARDGEDTRELLQRADVQLYSAKAAGRDCVAAEGYTGKDAGGNAPVVHSPLVGRAQTLEQITSSIDAGSVVTIAGVAGMGKTRLALHAACLHAGRFGKMAFIEAWSALDAADLAAQIQPLAAAGGDALAVLDGCEHLIEPVSEIIAELRSRNVRVIATSRVPLGVPNEQILRLQALQIEDSRAMFEECARQAGVLTDAGDPALENLLRRIGGNPLALQTAAQRLASASAAELVATIAQRGALPLERATIASIISASFARLSAPHARVLAAASTFALSFTTSGIAALLSTEDAAFDDLGNTLRNLAELGLLACDERDDDTYWTVPGLIRDAALEQPSTAQLRLEAARAHARWCLQHFAAIEERTGRVENQQLLQGIAPITREIEAALQRALTDRDLTAQGFELCWNASRYWLAAGRITEVYRWCEAFLDTGRGDDLWRMRLFAVLSRAAYTQGRIHQMEAYALQGLPLTGNDHIRRGALFNFLGIAAKQRGDAESATGHFRNSREANRQAGNRRGEAIAIASLGSVSLDLELDFESAAVCFEFAVRTFRELGDDLNALVIESNLVETLACQGQSEQALSIAERILPEARAFDNPSVILLLLSTFAVALDYGGHAGRLDTVANEALDLVPRLEPEQYHKLLEVCGRAFGHHGDYERAAKCFFASEWLQIREGDAVLAIDRHHHQVAMSKMNIDAGKQRDLMNAVRTLSMDELLHLSGIDER